MGLTPLPFQGQPLSQCERDKWAFFAAFLGELLRIPTSQAKMQARDGGDIPDLLGGRDIKNTLIIYIKNIKLSS